MALFQDEMIARTYFHQLIEGLEALHSNQLYHTNLSLANLLIAEGYMLKISDFTKLNSITEKINKKESRVIQAPELAAKDHVNPAALDIFAAGVMLFFLRTGLRAFSGAMAMSLGQEKLYTSLFNDQQTFWKTHEAFKDNFVEFSKPFKVLFERMTQRLPENRITIPDIKKDVWYKGPIYTKAQLKIIIQYKIKIKKRSHI